jgi:MFS family permease
LPVLLTRARAPVPVPAARMHVWTLYRIAPLGVFGVFCCGLINSSIHGLSPVYATNMGFTDGQLSTFMAVIIMSGLLLQWPIGRLSDRIGRGPLLVYIPIIVSLAAFAMLYTVRYELILMVAMFFGTFVFTLYSLSAATANDMVSARERVQVSGALLITYGAGAVSGPILAGQVMGLLGPQGLFFYFAIIALMLSGFAIIKRRRDGSPETRKPFVVVPASQSTSSQLYLSAHDETPEHVRMPQADSQSGRPSDPPSDTDASSDHPTDR